MLRAGFPSARVMILFRLLPRRTAGEVAPKDFLGRQGAGDPARVRKVCPQGDGRLSVIRQEEQDAPPPLRRLRDLRCPVCLAGG